MSEWISLKDRDPQKEGYYQAKVEWYDNDKPEVKEEKLYWKIRPDDSDHGFWADEVWELNWNWTATHWRENE